MKARSRNFAEWWGLCSAVQRHVLDVSSGGWWHRKPCNCRRKEQKALSRGNAFAASCGHLGLFIHTSPEGECEGGLLEL